MSDGITAERARQHLEAWLDAELKVSQGQSYSINGRSVTRANLTEIRKQITYWRKEVNKLSGKSIRTRRIVPRDF